jgi:hypothetical protein
MNTSFARFGLACTVALTMSVAIAKAGPAAAKITKVQGNAQISNDGSNWQTATAGQSLSAGAIIRTATDSFVDLQLSEGSSAGTIGAPVGSPISNPLIYFPDAGAEQMNMVRLNANTVLSIDTLTASHTGMEAMSETQLDLRKGSIFFSVKKLSASSKFEIKCPKGIAGVRGTSGWMNDLAEIRLSRGTMVETYLASDGVTTKTQVIQGKQKFDPSTGLLQSIDADMLQTILRAIQDLGIRTGMALPVTYIRDITQTVTSNINGELAPNDYSDR